MHTEEHETKKTFYITTAIHYANAGPHVGHAYEGVLADIIARYHRSIGEETFFLSGMDEHGQKIARSAEKSGKDPQVFVDENAEKFKDLYHDLNLSNDFFIRTTDQEAHFPGVRKLWEKLVDAGDIYKDTYAGLYCVGCERFMTEKDLVDGKCPDHDAVPEEVNEENYFFQVSKYQDQVRGLIESDTLRILPESRKEEVLASLKDPIADPSFSRPKDTVSWGIPVPEDESQVMYVWCDALSNYITALGYGGEDDMNYQTFWPAQTHVIGKDILRFHAVYWPAMLLSAGLPLPKQILAHGHLTSGGRKMSKTLGNVIDPHEMLEKYGSDAFRYYLAREISPFHDGDFTEEKFIESYNGNLANGIGNLVSRSISMAVKYFDGEVTLHKNVPVPLGEGSELEGEKSSELTIPEYFENTILPEYQKHMEAYRINAGADVVWAFIGELDGYITDYEPFKLIKTDKEKTENVLWNVLFGLDKIAGLIIPFMPETGKKIKASLGVEVAEKRETVFHAVRLAQPLFQKIETE